MEISQFNTSWTMQGPLSVLILFISFCLVACFPVFKSPYILYHREKEDICNTYTWPKARI